MGLKVDENSTPSFSSNEAGAKCIQMPEKRMDWKLEAIGTSDYAG
jgi:hypothetical protein